MSLQYKIPQNVQLEDKIVFFLTMRQLIICGIGFGIAYVIYISLAKSYYFEVWGPPVLIVAGLTAAIAFVKIKRMSFFLWSLRMIEAMILPHRRIWDKRHSSEIFFKYAVPPKTRAKKKTAEKPKQTKTLAELASALNYQSAVSDQRAARPLATVADHALASQAISPAPQS